MARLDRASAARALRGALLRWGAGPGSVGPGSVVSVDRGAAHNFADIGEDLTILVLLRQFRVSEAGLPPGCVIV